jgi:murein DD-endopeptidase MepM/ murein hydrolase activator NlpD
VDRNVPWGTSWGKPIDRALLYNTTYAAFSVDCPNYNSFAWYTQYLPSGTKQHLGIDLEAPQGTVVRAIADGKVTFPYPGQPDTPWEPKWGGGVMVEHHSTDRGYFTAVYGHINVGTNPRTGKKWQAEDLARQGEVLGTTANLSAAGAGAHLHFGITPGFVDHMPGSSDNGCRDKFEGTVDPINWLRSHANKPITNSVVGYQDHNGITSWLVDSNGRRKWIPTTDCYGLWTNQRGAMDWGPQPPRFLDQLPDQNGVHAC